MTTDNAVRVQVLVENTARGQGVQSEHGLAYWIEADERRIVLDTGQGLANVLTNNAEIFAVDLAQADTIVLSHGHYDHTGALKTVLGLADRPSLYAHPVALEPKYAPGRNGAVRSIGMSEENVDAVRAQTNEIVWTRECTEVAPGLFVTGEVPRVTDFEETGGRFFLDPDLTVPDTLPDDQSLFFASSEGTVVLLGCAHSGIVNTLLHISEITDGTPIHAVIGGTHLGAASPYRMSRTVEALREWNIQLLAPCHCTGLASTVALWQAFPGACQPCECGTVFRFV